MKDVSQSNYSINHPINLGRAYAAVPDWSLRMEGLRL
jgi:hypothetical protein